MTEQERKERVIRELKEYLEKEAKRRTKKNTIFNVEQRLRELTADDISFVEPIQLYELKCRYYLDVHGRRKYSDGPMGPDKILEDNVEYDPNESEYMVFESQKHEYTQVQKKLIIENNYEFDYADTLRKVADKAKKHFEQKLRVELYNTPYELRPVVQHVEVYERKIVTYPKVPITISLTSAKSGEKLQMKIGRYYLNTDAIYFDLRYSPSLASSYDIYNDDFSIKKIPYKKFLSRKWYV